MSELINYIDMPLSRLDQRGKELSWSINNINHDPERKAQIQHEISNIALEIWCRYDAGEVEIVKEK